jgi:multidrug efflux system membrane fusion protein
MKPLDFTPAVVVAVLVLFGCKPADSASIVAAAPVVPVQTAVSQRRDMPRTIESVGAVQALRAVAVKSQVDGMIAQIHFKEGDEVKAGAPLVSLDRRPFENTLRIASSSRGFRDSMPSVVICTESTSLNRSMTRPGRPSASVC